MAGRAVPQPVARKPAGAPIYWILGLTRCARVTSMPAEADDRDALQRGGEFVAKKKAAKKKKKK